MDLIKRKCVPCEVGGVALNKEQVLALTTQINKEWEAVEPQSADSVWRLTRSFGFKDFNEAMQFADKVAVVATAENHHPNLAISYNKVVINLWTHAVKGLSENDFILAAKIDAVQIDTRFISIDDVAKLEIKMGTILTAEKVEGADRLLKFSIDLGEMDSAGSPQARTIVSGVAQYYAPEAMVGKQVPVITNLAPRKMKGIESAGMIIYAIDEAVTDGVAGHVTRMLNPDREVPPGSPVQ